MVTAARPLVSAAPPRGIVRASARDGRIEGRRILPSPALAAFVHHYWSLSWDLRSDFTATTLPHPAARIVMEMGDGAARAEIEGVFTGALSKRLRGHGQVFGVQFRPATFQPLLRASMATLTDRVISASPLLGPRVDALARATLLAPTLAGKVAEVEAYLRPLLLALPFEVARVRDLVERMAVDRALLRVERAANSLAVDVRTLQRRFRRYVGLSPKLVARRYRIHEAAEQLRAASPPKLAELAHALGYADQAHFVREFRTATGQTPGTFIRSM